MKKEILISLGYIGEDMVEVICSRKVRDAMRDIQNGTYLSKISEESKKKTWTSKIKNVLF